MEHKVFFRPGKPEPEDHGLVSPYILTHQFPIGTQVLYPTGRVYMLIKTHHETTVLKHRWANIGKVEYDKLSPYLKTYALLEGITLKV